VGERVFKIVAADRVRWEWYFYGRPKVDANRYFLDFVRRDAVIQASHNIDWGPKPHFGPQPSEPAVEIL